MNKTLTTLLTGASLLLGNTCQAYFEGCFSADVGTTWRWDTVSYKGEDPNNVHFDAKWNDLHAVGVGGKLDYIQCNVLLRATGNYSMIYRGYGSERDWTTSRSNPTDHFKFEGDRGELFDFGFAVGYVICDCLGGYDVVFTPMLGWTQSEQHLREMNQEIVVNAFFDALPPALQPLRQFGINIPKIHNNYQTRWNGVWVGSDVSVAIPCTSLSLFAGFEWHWPQFKARGHYNTDETPIINAAVVPPVPTGVVFPEQKAKFTQKGHGSGFVARLGGEWFLSRCWSVALMGSYTSKWLNSGDDDYTVSLPAANAVVLEGEIDHVKWHSWMVAAALGYQF